MFKTPQGKARYFAAYDAMLARWPVQVEPIVVPTRLGPTYLNACGPEDAPSLLLIPGAAFSSTMWYPNIAGLNAHFRLYGLDVIGDMGKSILTAAKPALSGYESWLSDVLDGIGVGEANVAGLSLGGYIAARLAAFTPDRVRKLVLMSPAGFVPFRKRVLLALAGFVLPISLRTRLKWIVGADSPDTLAVFRQAITKTDFRYNMVLPKNLSDKELAGIRAPTLLLMGDADGVFDAASIFSRVQKTIPTVRCELIPGGGHALSLDSPDLVNRHILDFLDDFSSEENFG